MINFYYKILNAGITPHLSHRKARSIKLTNLLSLIFILAILVHIIIYLVLGAFALDTYLLAFLVTNLIILTLNSKGYTNAGKILLVVAGNYIIFLFGMTLSNDANFSHYYIIFISTAFLLFPEKDFNNRFGLVFGLILSTCGFLTLELYPIQAKILLSQSSIVILRTSNHITLLFCSIAQLFYWFYLEQKSEHEVQIGHMQLQTVFENMTEGVLLIDPEGKVIKTNSSALKILELSEKEIIGFPAFSENWHIVRENGGELKKEDSPSSVALHQNSIVNQMPLGIHRGDHHFRWISVSAAPVLDGMGSEDKDTPHQVIMTITDMTNIKESEIKLHHSAKLSSLGEMAAGIAHEINNPLSVIVGKSYILKSQLEANKFDTTSVSEQLTMIEKTAHRIATIIQGLRAFARDDVQQKMESHSVKSIIQDTLLLCSLRFSHHHIELLVNDIPDDLHIECRPTQISQVILNLLNNSFDAISDLKEKWIRIHVQGAEKVVTIRVTDSGPGIAKELQHKIFLPFFTTKEINRGTGMGLSISAGLIKSHQGLLELDINHEHTSFLITLPRKS